MIIDKPLLNGKLLRKSIDNWDVYWETNENYRHWCLQKHPENNETALLILFNPGSLNNNPDNLNNDLTLRVLRKVFHRTGINTFIINLFDYCTPIYSELNKNWEKRDYKYLVYEKLLPFNFITSIYAYGLIEKDDSNYSTIVKRIEYIKKLFENIPMLNYDNKKTTHPYRWQIENKKENIRSLLIKLYKSKK